MIPETTVDPHGRRELYRRVIDNARMWLRDSRVCGSTMGCR
jgi:hypothetical protein